MEWYSALFQGILAGVVYALSGYLRTWASGEATLRKQELRVDEYEAVVELIRFRPGEFLATIIQGALIGLASWGLTELGIPVTLQGAENILMQMGILTIVRKIGGMITNFLAAL
ncbi:MAG: hypothetical protein QW555_07915 [Nitrososphaerota archaeon]